MVGKGTSEAATPKDTGAGPWRARAKKLKDSEAYDELLTFARTRLESVPKDPLANAYLGYALAAKGEPEEALTSLALAEGEPKEALTALLLRSRLLQELGKDKESATLLDEAFRRSPNDTTLLLALMKAHVAADRPADALRLAHHLTQINPDNVASWRALLETAMSVGHYAEAVEAAGKVLAMDPDDGIVARYQALSLSKMGYLKDGILALQGHLETHPNDRDGWHDLGILQVQNNQNAEALESFGKSRELDRSNPATLLALGTLLAKMDRPEEALEPLTGAVKLRPEAVETHFNLAQVQERLGNLDAALDEYSRAAAASESHVESAICLGTLLAKMGRLSEARSQLEAAADKNPHSLPLLFNLACVYSALGDHYRSYMAFKRLNHHEPFDNEAWVLRGKELAQSLGIEEGSVLSWITRGEDLYARGSYVEAHECFRRALDLDPQNAVARPRRAQTLAAVYNIPPDDGAAWYRVARMLVELRLLSDAMDAVSLLFTVRPQDPDGRVLVGRILDSLARSSAALSQADICLKADPKHTGGLALKGESLLKLGKYAEALDTFEALLKLTPDDPTVLTFKGMALCQLKRGKEGLDAFDAAIALDPRNREAWYQKGLQLESEGQYESALQAFSRGLQ
jgi:tetratricopeptide (TPR) repeat protein